ncbi:MAG: Na/Pi cotransporter family protein [Phycisphaeraceae bacterium]|nr:MAG: Na/Pi cotransporter family protein [Phycisphaeraceae bacterium]
MFLATILGGVGLFLLGMTLMSDGLKAAAGDALRRILSRFTGGRFSAVASGAALTALVQSSSATTLATIGFVSAGLITFQQSVGVILGVNLGTTSTGWIVSVLGFRVQIAAYALPLVGVGALMKLLGRGRVSSLGTAIAGFGLIFIGIDVLQTGMEGLAERIDPASLPDATLVGRLLLVLIGVVMTVAMQSSSAAVATTLAALHTGAINIEQGAALVIGQNVGTTVKAMLVSIGGSTAVKRTAIAHILFNLVTGAVAFIGMPLFLWLSHEGVDLVADDQPTMVLAAFHTLFNVLGVAIFLPWLDRFSRMVMRIAPERGPQLTRYLDRAIASVPEVAVEAARRTVTDTAAVVVGVMARRLAGVGTEEQRHGTIELDRADEALREVRSFLGEARVAPGSEQEHRRHVSTLHAADHLQRLIEAARETKRVRVARTDPALAEMVKELADGAAEALRWLRAEPDAAAPVSEMKSLSERIAEHRKSERAMTLERTGSGAIEPDAAMKLLEAMRWVDRVAYHMWRAAFHLQASPPEEPSPSDAGEAG